MKAAATLLLLSLLLTGASGANHEVPQKAGHGYKSSRPWLPRVPVVTTLTGQELLAETALPGAFDWRNVEGRSFVTPDLNQHIPIYCGGCWIHGATHSLNDRIKVMRNAQFPDVLLSRQAMINCVPDPTEKGPPPGCHGGDAWMVHKYMHEHKIPDDSCMPYSAQNMECAPVSVCRNCAGKHDPATGLMKPDYCYAVENWAGYGVGDYGNLTGEDAMMREIYARGPIACSAATDDFFMYNYTANAGVLSEGVYTVDTKFTEDDIDHVMEVAGWGETPSGTKYWVVRNSWGTYWGDMGWVKMRRGVNQNLIESDCDWAVPEFEDLEKQLKSRVLGDYIHGTTNSGPRVGVASPLEVATLFQKPPPAQDRSSVLLAVFGGAIVGSVVTGLLAKRQSRQLLTQPGLLG